MSKSILSQTVPLSAISIRCRSPEDPYKDCTIEGPVLAQILTWVMHQNPRSDHIDGDFCEFTPDDVAFRMIGISEMLLSMADRKGDLSPEDEVTYHNLYYILRDYANRIRAYNTNLDKVHLTIQGGNENGKEEGLT